MTQERDRIGEIQDRLRRIETRLTKYMQERGFETQVQKPEWNDEENYIEIPSMDVRLKDVLEEIPTWMEGDVAVWHKDTAVAFIAVRR